MGQEKDGGNKGEGEEESVGGKGREKKGGVRNGCTICHPPSQGRPKHPLNLTFHM